MYPIYKNKRKDAFPTESEQTAMDPSRYPELATGLGFTRAALLKCGDVVLSDTFLELCEKNYCGNYGKCYACPPDVGDIHELMDMVRSYRQGVFLQTVTALEDSFDFEGMTAAAHHHVDLTLLLRDKIRTMEDDITVLGIGACRVCERCAKRDGEPCRRPQDRIIPLECCGINVSETCKAADMKYINGQDTVTYFGMILFDKIR